MELLLVFVSGLLGSSHCVGMCGGFVVTIGGAAPSFRENVARQLVYSSGRLCTYAFVGAIAGFAGWRLSSLAWTTLNLQALLAVLAGLFLITQGLVAAGILPKWRQITGRGDSCGGGCFNALLMSRNYVHCFIAGLFTGFLPCGLVYAFFSLAVGSANLFSGLAIMTAFGLGTIPILLLTGCSGSLISLRFRRHAFHIAAWCVVLTGVVSVTRGAFLYFNLVAPGVPFCG